MPASSENDGEGPCVPPYPLIRGTMLGMSGGGEGGEGGSMGKAASCSPQPPPRRLIRMGFTVVDGCRRWLSSVVTTVVVATMLGMPHICPYMPRCATGGHCVWSLCVVTVCGHYAVIRGWSSNASGRSKGDVSEVLSATSGSCIAVVLC